MARVKTLVPLVAFELSCRRPQDLGLLSDQWVLVRVPRSAVDFSELSLQLQVEPRRGLLSLGTGVFSEL